MKRRIIFFIAVVLVIPLISITAFAADGDSDGILGFLPDILYDIISVIFDGFYYIFSAIVEAVRRIGSFFASLIEAIYNAVTYLLKWLFTGLKYLFIPRDGYFSFIHSKIFGAISNKFGGIIYSVDYFRTRFSMLSSYKDSGELFVIKFPRSHFFNGLEFNMLDSGRDYISFLRSATTGILTLMTAAFCYRRILSILKT